MVGAHKDALAALDFVEHGNDAPNNNTDAGTHDMKVIVGAPNQGGKDDPQNGKADESYSQKAQLVQEEERKGRVGLWVYQKYVTTHDDI